MDIWSKVTPPQQSKNMKAENMVLGVIKEADSTFLFSSPCLVDLGYIAAPKENVGVVWNRFCHLQYQDASYKLT